MRQNIPRNFSDQYGFTLIELMISLVLGLLISAAVMQVFLTSQRVDRIQTAGSEIQDSAVFGLQAIESQVRLANLGNDGVPINDITAMGGIVLTAGNYVSGEGNVDDNTGGGDTGGGDNENTGEDGDGEDSDSENDKNDDDRKEDLEDDAKDLDKKAKDLDKKAKNLDKEAKKKDKEGKYKEAQEKRAEAERIRAEAERMRAEAERKRREAAQIGNNKAYSFRSMPAPVFQQASYQIADFQSPVFQSASVQRLDLQKVAFQKVAAPSAPALSNVMVNGGLSTGYLTRSNGMDSTDSNNTWKGLSNTGTPSDQLTIQYINTTGRLLYDCEGEEIELNARVITRYFVTDGGGAGNSARRNLNLNCDAGRIEEDGTLNDFTDSGETIIENIDQFNIRLGVQRSVIVDNVTTYQYADMTVADYMTPSIEKPAITSISIAILARSTANSPEASANEFTLFGNKQTLKTQANAPKYLRRVYESTILLRNARVMRIINTASV